MEDVSKNQIILFWLLTPTTLMCATLTECSMSPTAYSYYKKIRKSCSTFHWENDKKTSTSLRTTMKSLYFVECYEHTYLYRLLSLIWESQNKNPFIKTLSRFPEVWYSCNRVFSKFLESSDQDSRVATILTLRVLPHGAIMHWPSTSTSFHK